MNGIDLEHLINDDRRFVTIVSVLAGATFAIMSAWATIAVTWTIYPSDSGLPDMAIRIAITIGLIAGGATGLFVATLLGTKTPRSYETPLVYDAVQHTVVVQRYR